MAAFAWKNASRKQNAGRGVFWLNNRKRNTQRGYTRLAGVPPRECSTQQLQARVELLMGLRLAHGLSRLLDGRAVAALPVVPVGGGGGDVHDLMVGPAGDGVDVGR